MQNTPAAQTTTFRAAAASSRPFRRPKKTPTPHEAGNLHKTKDRPPENIPSTTHYKPWKWHDSAQKWLIRALKPSRPRVQPAHGARPTHPFATLRLSWPQKQHPAQSGITTTIAPQLRAGCWPDLISDSNERTPAATLAGFFLAQAHESERLASKRP